MTKDELCNYLIANGASSDLMQKPAVMERIYACFDVDSDYGLVTGNFYQALNSLSESVKVDEDGNIIVNDGVNSRIFKRLPNNEASYTNNDESGYSIDEPGEYIIDKYGMDKKFRSTDNHSITRKEDGTIDADGLTLNDNGSPLLNLYDLLNSTPEKTWKKNKKTITKRYERTENWFKDRERRVKEENEKSHTDKGEDSSNEPIKELDKRIQQLQAENEALQAENIKIKNNSVPKEEIDNLKKQKRKVEIEKTIIKAQSEEQKESNRKLTEQNTEQTKQNQQLKAQIEQQRIEIQSLKNRNQNLQRMLNQTLNFCEIVRNSFWGKLFFKGKLKQLPAGEQTNNEKPKEEEPTR